MLHIKSNSTFLLMCCASSMPWYPGQNSCSPKEKSKINRLWAKLVLNTSVFTLPLAGTAYSRSTVILEFFKNKQKYLARLALAVRHLDPKFMRRWNLNNGTARAVRLRLIINGETCVSKTLVASAARYLWKSTIRVTHSGEKDTIVHNMLGHIALALFDSK